MSYWTRNPRLQLLAKFNEYHDELGRFASEGEFAERLVKAGKSGGFTFTKSGKTPTEGYSVGMYPEHSKILDVETASTQDVTDWLDSNKSLLSQSGNYMGGWVDKGKLYLDVVKVFPPSQKQQAIKIGKEKNQIAIADMAAIHRKDWDNAFINTGGTGVTKKELEKKETPKTPEKPKFALLPGTSTAKELLEAVGVKLKK